MSAIAGLVVLLVLATASAQQPSNIVGRRLTDCLQQSDFMCVKAKILSNLNKVLQMKSFRLFNGVSVEQDDDATPDEADEVLESVSRAAGGTEDRLDNNLFSSIYKLFKNRSLKLDLVPGVSARVSGSKSPNGVVDIALETSRGSNDDFLKGNKGLKKGGGMLLLGGMFGATLLTIAFAILKVLAFKALLVGKISLLLSVINGLKDLVGAPKKQIIYDNYDFYDKHASYGDEQYVHARAYGGQMPQQQQ